MGAIRRLLELQEIDLEIDQRTSELDSVNARIGENDEVVAAQQETEEARKRLTDLEHRQRETEFETDELSNKIAEEEKKLYAGSVKNPKELMGLQKEVELIREQRQQKEDGLLALMLDVDSARDELRDKGRRLEELEARWNSEQAELQARKEQIESELDALTGKRAEVVADIDPPAVSLYESLRAAKHGRAVARVEQGMCTGCRISLPMSDQQKARMGQDVVTCSNCGRILCP